MSSNHKKSKRKSYKQYNDILKEGLQMFLSGEYNRNRMSIAKYLKDTYPKRLLDYTPTKFCNNLLNKYINKHIHNEHTALAAEAEKVGIPLADIKHYWYKGEHFSIDAKPQHVRYEDVREELIQEMLQYSPKYKIIPRKYTDEESYLLVIDPADIHIGKLSVGLGNGTEYNNDIAVKRVHEGVLGILKKARGYQIDQILFIAGNDVLHIDSPSRKTANNTPQDTDGMWYSNYQIAKKLYVDIIEILLTVADVHVQFDPSNHDFTNGFFLCDAINVWFRNNGQVTFNGDIRHRKYFKYYNNLIGTSHGDGAKVDKLPLMMADEAQKWWGCTKHKYFYLHHLHHKYSKDMGPVCIEGLRSPSGTDYWHHKNGFQGSPKAVEGFLHHKEHGQVARFTHIF